MNKQLPRKICMLALLWGAGGGGSAWADSLNNDYREVTIKFSEPVVSLTTVQNSVNAIHRNSRDEKLTPADRGLDLFTLTGDPQRLPQAYWQDQDRLVLVYPEGSDSRTAYQLQFKPGVTYLSKRPLQQSSYSFTRPSEGRLSATALEGTRDSVLVTVDLGDPRWGRRNAGGNWSRECMEFGSKSPVTYSFVERKQGARGRVTYGKEIPATVRPATLADGLSASALSLLNKRKFSNWGSLTPASELPGQVVVSPESPLDPSCSWEVRSHAPAGSGFSPMQRLNSFITPVPELLTDIGQDFRNGKRRLVIRYNATIPASAVPQLFRSIGLSLGGQKATLSPDGLSWELKGPDGRAYSFRLAGPLLSEDGSGAEPRPIVSQSMDAMDDGSEDSAKEKRISYTEPDCARGFIVEVTGADTPVDLDVTLPPGAKAKRGLEQKQLHKHRITLTPAWPALKRSDEALVVPLKGERKLLFKATNCEALKVTAYRWDGENAAICYPMIRQNLRNTDTSLQRAYLRELLAKRTAAGLKTDSFIAPGPQDEGSDAGRRSALANAQAYPEQSIATGCDASACNSRDVVLSLDALTGGESKPGLYLIQVRQQASEPVRRTLESIGMPADSLDVEQDFLLQLTDLVPTTDRGAYLLTRRSDGSLIESGKIRFFGDENSAQRNRYRSRGRADGSSLLTEQGDPVTLAKGCAITPRSGLYVLAEAGEDYVIFPGNGGRSATSPSIDNETFTDRPIYRPGDTVYLRSILRKTANDNNAELPGVRSAKLSVRRPNGEVMLTRDIAINEYGAFDTSFELPTGDEDVTGNYLVQIQSPDRAFSYNQYVFCQVFRRDSMKGDLTLDVGVITPTEARISVSAADLNGASLEGARVSLRYCIPEAAQTLLDSAQDPIEGLKEPFKLTGTDSVKEVETQLSLDERGCAELKLPLPALGNNAAGAYVSVDASLTNDREESFVLDSKYKNIYPGSFRMTYGNGTLTLTDNESNKPWAHAQSVHTQIISHERKAEQLPNGFELSEAVDRCIKEYDVTVPANAEKGVTIDISDEMKDRSAEHSLTLLFSTRDEKGRSIALKADHYFFMRPRGREEIPHVESTRDGSGLSFSATFRSAGDALALIGVGDELRAQVVPVTAGTQTIKLPLKATDGGNVAVTLLRMAKAENGTYEEVEGVSTRVDIPCDAKRLRLALDLPQQPSLPGSRITLSGRVTTPEGKPADAEVTFYAVDAGMLSVGGYSLPDPLGTFCDATGTLFRPAVRLTQDPRWPIPGSRDGEACSVIESAMPGLWLGDLVEGPGNTPSLPGRYTLCVTENTANGIMMTGYGNAAAKRSSRMAMAANDMIAPQAMAAEAACFDCAEADGFSGEGSAYGKAPERALALAQVDSEFEEGDAGYVAAGATPRLRSNFIPVAFWQGALHTDADGRFSTEVTLPDTLTTYRVFAVAIDRSGALFGSEEGSFIVNQPVMLTPGTPLFMSLGDTLRLPVTITNNTAKEDSWEVTLEGSAAPQTIRLGAGKTGTLYFDVTAEKEGENVLTWTARAASSSDAVEGRFPVRFPAPVLKESHRLVLQPGQDPLAVAKLLAPELASSTRGSMTIEVSANPLLHLAGCAEYVLGYPYGCTEQTASGLMPYLLYKRLAPFSPKMAETPEEDVVRVVESGIKRLFERQLKDGGLGYWSDSDESSPWASAHAGLIFTIAAENGYELPAEPMTKLRDYLRRELEKDKARLPEMRRFNAMNRYSIGRCLGDDKLIESAINEAAGYKPDEPIVGWRNRALPDLSFIAELRRDPANRHSAFLRWMRSRGHDYRHNTTWQSSWTLIALAEYLRLEPESNAPSRLKLGNGQELTLGNGATGITPESTGERLSDISTTLSSLEGPVYVTVKVKALPETRDYPGLTEKGLQITRLYEKKGADGVWRPATEFAVGDVVRVTLTCAKVADELEYFVLEDYLPACMEAINPNIPSQAAGLEPLPWSLWFDHREYLPERVRGFCTRWAGRDLLNMRYYARVKRAGRSMAPPAEAQLMYEPQTYGLSENKEIISK